jgi:hypothetical protein
MTVFAGAKNLFRGPRVHRALLDAGGEQREIVGLQIAC